MLSYQHDYHSGNFADIHKHLTLRVLFESLLKKDKPFYYIDCHAGSGQYDLQTDKPSRNKEYISGIARIWETMTHPMAPKLKTTNESVLEAYIKAISTINTKNQLRYCPGSPCLAQQWLRTQDKAHFLELHPQALKSLRRYFKNDSRISLHARDCYEGLPALVPPTNIKRGLILLDPSYEQKDEYSRIVSLLVKAYNKWPTGIYAIWYPLLPENRDQYLMRALTKSGIDNILISELTVAQNYEGAGLYGSGMAIVNPPWLTDKTLSQLMPTIAELLSPGVGESVVHYHSRSQGAS